MTARSTPALLAALLALTVAGCGGGGGGDKPAPAKQAEAPAEEGAPVGSAPTPDNCMLKAGLESIEKPSKRVWTAFHPDGYAVRVQKFGSPAAAHGAVEAAPGIADQANFFAVFGPAEDEANGATLKVAKCLRTF
ncbi:MAG: hypothetical protein QOE60_131 [Thermoleophilaceae bacterium]|jgi:hypothetical protein|nr:hypothetical protein [Thermoleophilaceae bacterium]